MQDPVRQYHVPFAAQQPSRGVARLIGGRASSRFWSSFAVTLFGVALLGAAATVREFDISIHNRQVEGGASTIRVNRGETVLLRWRTDEPVSVHLHGYDIQATLSPKSPSVMRFVAALAGRFPIEAHAFGAVADQDNGAKKHREVTLLYLEVMPE